MPHLSLWPSAQVQRCIYTAIAPGCHTAAPLSTGKLVGDSLLAAAFVSYAGPFNMEFRKRLANEKWLPDLTERQIPLTTGFLPLDMLADESSKVNDLSCCTCVLVGCASSDCQLYDLHKSQVHLTFHTTCSCQGLGVLSQASCAFPTMRC